MLIKNYNYKTNIIVVYKGSHQVNVNYQFKSQTLVKELHEQYVQSKDLDKLNPEPIIKGFQFYIQILVQNNIAQNCERLQHKLLTCVTRIQTSLTLNQLQIFSKNIYRNNIDIEQNNKTKQYYHYLQNVCNLSIAHVNNNKELTQAILGGYKRDDFAFVQTS